MSLTLIVFHTESNTCKPVKSLFSPAFLSFHLVPFFDTRENLQLLFGESVYSFAMTLTYLFIYFMDWKRFRRFFEEITYYITRCFLCSGIGSYFFLQQGAVMEADFFFFFFCLKTPPCWCNGKKEC